MKSKDFCRPIDPCSNIIPFPESAIMLFCGIIKKRAHHCFCRVALASEGDVVLNPDC